MSLSSSSSSNENYVISDDEKLWAFIAWLIPLIGGILALVLKPSYKFAKYWSYLSISFFIIIIIANVITILLRFIPILDLFISILIGLGLFIVWILGILKSLQKVYWKPKVIYDIAQLLGIEHA
ncbi:MAG: hypothetical protein ACP5L0_02815 [Caldisphaera sp.]